eukprot:jgi/Mesvir1/3722/Mv15000-RA.1
MSAAQYQDTRMLMNPESVQTDAALRNVSATLDALELVAMCNALLAASGIDAHVNSVDEVRSLITSTSVLVAAMECVCGEPLEGVVRNPAGTQDRLWNFRVLLSSLSSLISSDLTHISAERLVTGDCHDIKDLLEILVSLLRAMPRLGTARDRAPGPDRRHPATEPPALPTHSVPIAALLANGRTDPYASIMPVADKGSTRRNKTGENNQNTMKKKKRVQYGTLAGIQPRWRGLPAAEALPSKPAPRHARAAAPLPLQPASRQPQAPHVPQGPEGRSWPPEDEGYGDDGSMGTVQAPVVPVPRPKTSRGHVVAATVAAPTAPVHSSHSPVWAGAFSPEPLPGGSLASPGGGVSVAIGGELGRRGGANAGVQARQIWAREGELGGAASAGSGSVPPHARPPGQSHEPQRGLPPGHEDDDGEDAYDDDGDGRYGYGRYDNGGGGWMGLSPHRFLATSEDTQDLHRDIVPGDRSTIVVPKGAGWRQGRRRVAAVVRKGSRPRTALSNFGYVTVAGLGRRKSGKKKARSKKKKARLAPHAQPTGDASDLSPYEGGRGLTYEPGSLGPSWSAPDARRRHIRDIGDGAGPVASSVLLSAHPGLHKYLRDQLWSLGEMKGKAGAHCLRAAMQVLKRSQELDRAAHVRREQLERLRAAALRREQMLLRKKREQGDRIAMHDHAVEKIRAARFQQDVVRQELARRQAQHSQEYALLKHVFLRAVRQEKERVRGDVREERQHASIYQQESDALYTNAEKYYREQCAILQEQIRWERTRREQATRDEEVMVKELAREARSRAKEDRGALLQQVAHEEKAAHFNVMDPKLISEIMVSQLKKRLAQS